MLVFHAVWPDWEIDGITVGLLVVAAIPWLARGAGQKGVVYYTDTEEENARQAEVYFKRAGVSDQVRLLIGNALYLIDTV